MAKRVVDETSLASVADAIRERAGTTDALAFPDGFVSAVENIPDLLAAKLNDTLTEYESEMVTKVGNYGLAHSKTLKRVILPNVTALSWCSMEKNTVLEYVYVPKLKTPGYGAFQECAALSKLDLPVAEYLDTAAFSKTAMQTLILRRTSAICQLGNAGAFSNTPIASGTGYIYVPRSLVDSYKAATNWSNYASQIRAIEDYPDITGG